jgi:two-component system, NarL family, nitrate/nitrite response regulator NarL
LASEIVARFAELARCIESEMPVSNVIACLTPREREVLKLIGRNFSNRDIADHLIIEVGTVKNHVHNILSKLNVRSRRETASYLPVAFGQLGSEPVIDFSHLVSASKHYLRI